MQQLVRLLLVAGVSIGITAAVAPDADACARKVDYDLDEPTQLVLKAERALDAGQVTKAQKLVKKAFPGTNWAAKSTKKGHWRKKNLQKRAKKLVAVATIRRDGIMSHKRKRLAAKRRTKNVEWAVGVLEEMSKARKDDPYLQARLAEGLAKLPGKQAKAAELLDKLAADDIMPDARSYAVLAELKHAAGDAKARDAAMQRCKAMAEEGTDGMCSDFMKQVAGNS